MAGTMVDIDDDALAEAMRLMGVRTKKDAVNTALREYVKSGERLVAAERLAGAAAAPPQGQVRPASGTVPQYLLDITGVRDLLDLPSVREGWREQIRAGVLRVCPPVRAEMLRLRPPASVQTSREADRPGLRAATVDLDTLFGPPVPLPPDVWDWGDLARRRLTAAGVHDVTVLDLLVAATAAWNNMTVLHSNPGLTAVATVIPHLRHRPIRPL